MRLIVAVGTAAISAAVLAQAAPISHKILESVSLSATDALESMRGNMSSKDEQLWGRGGLPGDVAEITHSLEEGAAIGKALSLDRNDLKLPAIPSKDARQQALTPAVRRPRTYKPAVTNPPIQDARALQRVTFPHPADRVYFPRLDSTRSKQNRAVQRPFGKITPPPTPQQSPFHILPSHSGLKESNLLASILVPSFHSGYSRLKGLLPTGTVSLKQWLEAVRKELSFKRHVLVEEEAKREWLVTARNQAETPEGRKILADASSVSRLRAKSDRRDIRTLERELVDAGSEGSIFHRLTRSVDERPPASTA